MCSFYVFLNQKLNYKKTLTTPFILIFKKISFQLNTCNPVDTCFFQGFAKWIRRGEFVKISCYHYVKKKHLQTIFFFPLTIYFPVKNYIAGWQLGRTNVERVVEPIKLYKLERIQKLD